MRATCLSFQRLTALTLVLFAVLCQPAPALAGWGETALSREGDYIVNCSWTQLAKNGSAIRPTDDAYGSLNDNRIAWNGPDWVRPGEDSEAMISLLAAIPTMQQAGVDTKSYVRLQDLYFDSWITGSHAGPVFLATGAEAGGVPSQLHYSHTGKWLKSDGASAATTGIVLAAMYKRYEYYVQTGQTHQGRLWLRKAWPLAVSGAGYLARCYNPKTGLLQGNPWPSSDMWIQDTVLGASGLVCVESWAGLIDQPDPVNASLVDKLKAGLAHMRCSKAIVGFYRVNSQNQPSFGTCVDQLCFLPYESGLLAPSDPFASKISDFWTDAGGGGAVMTPETSDPTAWTYFGSHWHWYFKPRDENNYLYPGPGLQLCAVEWKIAKATGNKAYMTRAQNRFAWANSADKSNLWVAADDVSDAGVGDGFIDWSDSRDHAHKAQAWARFVDTSGYFIRATLMICYGQDVSYVPLKQTADVP